MTLLGTVLDDPHNTEAYNALVEQQAEKLPINAVSSRMDLLNTYAADAYLTTVKYMKVISDLANALEVPDVGDIQVPQVTIAPVDYSVRPSLGNLALPNDWPVNDAVAPNLTALPALVPVTFPVLSVVAPVYTEYAAPTMDNITAPGDLPTINPVSIPVAPSIALPSPPTFDEILIASAPDITLPVFDAEIPVFALDEPISFSWGEPTYVSDIWADLLAKVLYNIQNGGTGLEVAVELDLYNRHLDRVADENAKAVIEVEEYFASRGFTMPPGALAGAINEISQQIVRNNLAASRDITISQAELAQKNTHFIYELGFKLEGMLRDFYTSCTNRVLDAAYKAAENAIARYNAQVQKVNLDLDVYKTKASVYEAQVKAALVSVEIFKAQIEGSKVTAEVQKVLSDIYDSQVRAVKTYTELYVAEMQGAKIASEIELTKLEIYKAETQTFIARLDGEKAKLGIFEAQLRGEGVKADVYKAQVSAFGTEVDAASKVLLGRISELDLAAKVNGFELDRYKTELSAYEVKTRAKLSEIQALVSGFQAETSAYSAETGAIEAQFRVQVEEMRMRIAEADFNLRKAVAEIEAVTKGYEAIKSLQLKSNEGIMNMGAQLTASSLNAINASVSIGTTQSVSTSRSQSESLTENHDYQEK